MKQFVHIKKKSSKIRISGNSEAFSFVQLSFYVEENMLMYLVQIFFCGLKIKRRKLHLQ